MAKIHKDIKYKQYGFRMSAEVWKELNAKRKILGLSWNLFIKYLINK